jgi:UPF0716 protein FxsA
VPIVALALLVVPIAELFVLIQVGQRIGVLETIAVLVGISVLGAWLLKREGIRAWTAFTTATSSGRLPAREVADGALVMFGGALLLTPGFLTDVVGLLCLLPPTRVVLRRSLLALVTRRAVGHGGWTPRAMRVRSYRAGRTGPGRPSGSRVIDGEVHERGEPPTA